jgi:hypothetical protein
MLIAKRVRQGTQCAIVPQGATCQRPAAIRPIAARFAKAARDGLMTTDDA